MDHTPTHPTGKVAAPVNMSSARYAGFWIRLLAGIIDAILLGIVSNLLFGSSVASMQDGVYSVSYSGWNMLIPVVFYIGFWIALSTTPGGLLLKLRIVDAHGKKLAPVTAIIRYLGFLLSGFVLGIGFLWIAFDSKKQGWHDKIAKTFVVRI